HHLSHVSLYRARDPLALLSFPTRRSSDLPSARSASAPTDPAFCPNEEGGPQRAAFFVRRGYLFRPSSPGQPPLVNRATSSKARGRGVVGGAAMNFGRQSGPNLAL